MTVTVTKSIEIGSHFDAHVIHHIYEYIQASFEVIIYLHDIAGRGQRPTYPSASFPWCWSLAYSALTGAGAGEGQECGVGESVSWS